MYPQQCAIAERRWKKRGKHAYRTSPVWFEVFPSCALPCWSITPPYPLHSSTTTPYYHSLCTTLVLYIRKQLTQEERKNLNKHFESSLVDNEYKVCILFYPFFILMESLSFEGIWFCKSLTGQKMKGLVSVECPCIGTSKSWKVQI